MVLVEREGHLFVFRPDRRAPCVCLLTFVGVYTFRYFVIFEPPRVTRVVDHHQRQPTKMLSGRTDWSIFWARLGLDVLVFV